MSVRTSTKTTKASKTVQSTKTTRGKNRKTKDNTKPARDVAVRRGMSHEPAKQSGAAKRAYERRQQRAATVGGGAGAATVLPKKGSSFAARIPFVAAIIALLSCGLVVTLLLTTRAAEDSYDLSAARLHNQRLAEERAALQRDVEAANSAPDLAARARDLGMIPAKDPARLVVGPDGSVVVVGTPSPAVGAPVPLLNGATPTSRTGQPGAGSTTRGTPQVGNGATVTAHGEQLVPMTTSAPMPSEPAR